MAMKDIYENMQRDWETAVTPGWKKHIKEIAEEGLEEISNLKWKPERAVGILREAAGKISPEYDEFGMGSFIRDKCAEAGISLDEKGEEIALAKPQEQSAQEQENGGGNG